MKELAYLNRYLWRYRGLLFWGLVFVIISNVFQIVPAQMVRRSIDLVTNNINLYRSFNGMPAQQDFFDVFTQGILLYAILILIMALLRGLFLYFVRQTLIVMSRHIEYDLKNDIFQHYQTLPLSFYRRNNTGDLMNRISEDVSRVRMYLGPSIMYGLQLFTLFVMLIPVMFMISVKLTLFALIPLPILSFSIYYVNNLIERRSEEIQQSQSRLSTFVQEAFSGIRVLKSFNREKESVDRFTAENNEYKKRSLHLTRIQSLFFPLMFGLIGLSTILTVYQGSVEVIEGSLTFGNIVEFVIYVNLLTWPVASLGWTSSLVQRAEASQKRINEFLKAKTDLVSVRNLRQDVEGKIEFQNVSFTYPDTGIQAVRNLSFTLHPGDSLAVIGATGSGKSTVASLISRLYDVSSGQILIDDVPIEYYDISHLRGQIGYVPQDVFLFSDTILNNIGFGLKQQDEEKIHQAARAADVYENIMDFPLGFATRIGERGITLSGGQKQRVSIARAIVREPRILMLDDALSAVDTKTEDTILNSMRGVMKGRTTLIISHRVSSAKLANKIIVLQDGAMAEAGTHESLMEHNGLYRELYDRQMRAEEQQD